MLKPIEEINTDDSGLYYYKISFKKYWSIWKRWNTHGNSQEYRWRYVQITISYKTVDIPTEFVKNRTITLPKKRSKIEFRVIIDQLPLNILELVSKQRSI